MGYTTIHKLQLYCIFMIAVTGIECVFFVVKMAMDPITIIQLTLIVALFIIICVGYNATITRSPKKSLLFYRGVVVVEILEMLEFSASLYLVLASHKAGAHTGMGTLLAWEAFNISSTAVGAYFGRKVHIHFSSGAFVDFYVDPSVLHANTDYRVPRPAAETTIPLAGSVTDQTESETLMSTLVADPQKDDIQDL